ncbi:hypothetical protein LZ32DRAFT_607163 [Colletotrichum eremochloae]|nr:hypothetical protein LZ32DRAFT_607163 [Colletotrichum eremochloae]
MGYWDRQLIARRTPSSRSRLISGIKAIKYSMCDFAVIVSLHPMPCSRSLLFGCISTSTLLCADKATRGRPYHNEECNPVRTECMSNTMWFLIQR